MKNFLKNFDPIFGVEVVKLQFHVAVAVAVEMATARWVWFGLKERGNKVERTNTCIRKITYNVLRTHW